MRRLLNYLDMILQRVEGAMEGGFGSGVDAQEYIACTNLGAGFGDLIAADGEIDGVGGFGAAGAEFEDDVADSAGVHLLQDAAGGGFELTDEGSAMHGGDFLEGFDAATLQGDHLLKFAPCIAAMKHLLEIGAR